MINVFEKLIRNNIDKFVYDYKKMSRQVFVDDEGKQIHSGEFGLYRERIVKEFIKPFLPSRLDVGTGFIIASNNKISTQCDLIIYDKFNTPIIETYEQRFFPVECVVGVIEVKSKLTKQEFKEALIKLSNIKKMRDYVDSERFIFRDVNRSDVFDTKNCVRDQLATMLICEKIDIDFKNNISAVFNDIYHEVDKSLYHNMILSIDNGCLLYSDSNNIPIYHSYVDYKMESFENDLIYPHELGYKYEHLILFLDYFYMLISSISVLYVEITNYLGKYRTRCNIK
ncbi:hypothetical protein DYE49_02460 [Treponema rectale]|uniref:DUF6602 domain-containing protein n=1 Tax=Treponema rectale TaxID=744512 RepID=A0A7M1XJ04_9SPIR|nr:hypothetical protein DYE49_02460 [Treponema rectale]